VTGVIPHASTTLDNIDNAGQRPQVSVESVGASATTKSAIDARQLLGIETRQAASSPSSAKRGRAAALPLLIPTTDALTTDVEHVRDCRLDVAAREQSCCPLASLLERFEITTRAYWFHVRIICDAHRFVTLLCETQ